MESRGKPEAGSLGPEDGVNLHRIVGHRDEWWWDFNRLALVLAQDIPDVVAVEHIGSTAIPRMPARDILDVEVVMNKIEDETAFSAPLQPLGFRRFNPRTSRPPVFACLSQKMAAAASIYMSARLAAPSTAAM